MNRKQPSPPRSPHLLLGIPYGLVLVVLIVIPLFLMVFYSFLARTNSSFGSLAFTFENYTRFFREPLFISLLVESLVLALLATVVTLIIGYPLAYLIARSRPNTQFILLLLITAPMWLNMLLRTRALQQIFEMIAPEWLGTNTAIVIGMSYLFLPFMVLPIFAALHRLDESLIECAADLGAHGTQRFVRVILPLSLPGILSGIMMVFLPAATTLIIPKYLGEGRFLLGNLIENAMIQQGNYGYGSAIALVMVAMIIGFLYILRKVDRAHGGHRHEQT